MVIKQIIKGIYYSGVGVVVALFIFGLIYILLIPRYGIHQTSGLSCQFSGGNWHKGNGGVDECSDSCVIQHGGYCASSLSLNSASCDCGPGKCWNGTSCEAN